MPLTSPAPGLSDDASGLRDHAYDWALVDVETSGLIARRDRVLSVAVVTLGPDGEPTGEFSTLLNPGCDPGPVEVHGLTAERLRGAPGFDQVAGRIGAMLQGRVLVAHNAQFDYDFLAHEFARVRMWLPVTQRLCTLALNRRVDPPTEDLTLDSLAAHYGVPRRQAHDALDDTRVLAGVLRASLREAARLDLPLPLVACPPRQDPRFTPQPPKTACAYRNPGRLVPGGPLRQGMKIAITGQTTTSRAELVGRSVAAGLNVMSSVSRHTSALVTNDAASDSAKARRALAENVPVIDERTFLRLLDDVRPGTPHERTTPAAVPSPRSEAAASPRPAAAPSPSPATASSPSPATAPCPRPEAAASPRSAAAPSPRSAAAPCPSPVADPSAGPAAVPSAHSGVVPSPRPEADPPAHSGVDTSPRPAADPAGPAAPSAHSAAVPSSRPEAAPPGREPQRPAGEVRKQPRRPRPAPDGPLAGRRVLVLGGTHPAAAAARSRIVELGGAAAINLSASVTDVVLLDGRDADRRMRRIVSLAIPTHDAPWLAAPDIAPVPRPAGGREAAHVLPRGGVVDIPAGSAPGTRWTVTASWAQQTACEIDVVAFVVDEDEQVSFDEDFVFYGAPENPGGTVRLLGDGPTEQTVSIDLAALPPSSRKVVVAAAIDGAPTFGDVGAIHVTAGPGTSAAPLVQATLDAATTERTMLLTELYRRGPLWRLRAVGQGYDHGLAALARGYGVDIAD
ncbi:TerD family protein [Streptomyces demainii]|uniref:DNA polymerase-3 subunit epsilon n=1 Tax=Streptomyces demainii TaxID=588122 RepID=A0ABT9KNN0_9ACTN|nr:TerD family protein [Streptomyces demainii]MDP9610022.1 DNA polymerase-3 subunit epsilon [Streptomyces demainii]